MEDGRKRWAHGRKERAALQIRALRWLSGGGGIGRSQWGAEQGWLSWTETQARGLSWPTRASRWPSTVDVVTPALRDFGCGSRSVDQMPGLTLTVEGSLIDACVFEDGRPWPSRRSRNCACECDPNVWSSELPGSPAARGSPHEPRSKDKARLGEGLKAALPLGAGAWELGNDFVRFTLGSGDIAVCTHHKKYFEALYLSYEASQPQYALSGLIGRYLSS